jgi:hypothetical protein
MTSSPWFLRPYKTTEAQKEHTTPVFIPTIDAGVIDDKK